MLLLKKLFFSSFRVFTKAGVCGLFFLGVTASFSCYAQQKIIPLHTDHRIVVVAYQKNNVVPLAASVFVNTQIIFSAKEHVVDVEGGDAAAWSVVINPDLPNVINLKPLVDRSDANMSVVTLDPTMHRRYYRFSLSCGVQPAKKSYHAAPIYALEFVYPAEELKIRMQKNTDANMRRHALLNPATDPSHYHWDYSFSGDRVILPLHVFDDGKFTYFQLRPGQPIPAVFMVDNTAGQESVVNAHREGRYWVVYRVAPQFTLRYGSLHVLSIFNNVLIRRHR